MFTPQIIIASIILTLILLLIARIFDQSIKAGARTAQILYESRIIDSTKDWVMWYLKKLRDPYLILFKILTVTALVMIQAHRSFIAIYILLIFCFHLARIGGGKQYLNESAHRSQSS